MKLSKDTLAILKNFSLINNGITLKEGNLLMTRTADSTKYAEAVITDNIDQEISIYDLNGFLSIVALSDDDANIKLENGRISIKGSRSELLWDATTPDNIVSPKRRLEFPNQLFETHLFEFDFDKDFFNQLMKGGRGTGSDTFVLMNEDGRVKVKAYNIKADDKLNDPKFILDVDDCNISKTFKLIIRVDNMCMLPDAYNIKIWHSEQANVLQFVNENRAYVIAVEIDSIVE